MSEEGAGGAPADSGGRAVLVRSSGAGRATTCADQLPPDPADGVDLLYVGFGGEAPSRLESILASDAVFERTAVATVGAGAAGSAADRTLTIDDVESVEHLSELGMYVREVVFDWEAADRPTVVCFDSVTALLDRVDLEMTFEFLLVLVDGIRPAGALAYFYVDADAHDRQTMRTLEHLFDEVVTPD